MAGRDLVFTILGIDKASPAFKQVGDAAERAGARIDRAGSASIKAMAGMTAGAVGGGVAIGAAIGAVPVLFAAVAAAALASNDQVSDSFSNLAANIVDDVQDIASPLQDDMVGVANDLGDAWADVYPSMRKIFADPAMAKGVRELSGGVGDLARNAMPGLVESVARSGPVMTGLRRVLGDVGTGTSDLLINMSQESEAAGVVLTGFGGIVRTTLGDLGGLAARATSAVAPHMDEIEALFDNVTGSAVGLATNALPIVTSSTGAAVSVLNSMLGVLEPISGQLGTGLGLALAAAGGWRVLTGAGNAYTKLDLGGKLERTALSAGVMTEGLTGSATAGEKVATAGTRLGGVLRGVGQAIPLVGVAAVGLGLALEASAQGMKDATERGASLGESLIKGGSEAERARQAVSRMVDENKELQASLNDLEKEQVAAGEAGHLYAAQISDLHTKIDENNTAVDTSRSKYKEIRDSLTGAELAQVKYNEAVAAYGAGSQEAAAAGVAWRAALDAEKAKQDAAAAATRTHTEKLIEQQGIMLGAVGAGLNYQASLLATESAEKALAQAVKDHGAGSLEARQAGVQYEQQLLSTVNAIGEKVKAENAGKSVSEQATLVTAAQGAEILRLASAAGENAPAALMNMVKGLDSATLSALGVTGRINEAGDAVLRLPDGKEVVITGRNADAIRKIQEVNDTQLVAKTLWINAVVRQDSKTAVGFGDSGRARGGRVDEGQAVTVGEEGRERWVPDGGPGYMIPHTQTQALERARRMDLAGLGAGGGGDRHFHLTVYGAGNTEIDLASQFARLEALEGW